MARSANFPTRAAAERAAAKQRAKPPPKVSVPYAPTATGKAAEQAARGHITVPYAPTPTGKAAEQHRRPAKRLPAILRPGTEHKGGINLGGIASSALNFGKTPGSENPVGHYLKESAKEDFKTATSSPVLKGEPPSLVPPVKRLQAAADVTSFIPAAEGASAIDKAVTRAATAGSDASSAAKLAEKAITKAKAIPKKKITDIKTAPARTARRIKETPQRARELPGKAKRAATTPEGRRGVAKSAAKHPVRTSYGAAVVTPEGVLPGDVTKRARGAAEGTINAIIHHPVETGKTTLRALPAAITAPAALAAAAGASVLHGTPKPLENTASEQAKGVAQIASDTFSGDPKKAEEAARKEGSLAFLTPLPAITRLGKYEKARSAIRDTAGKVRAKIASKGEAANRSVRHAPTEQSVFAATGRHEARKKTALVKQRADNPHRVSAAHHERIIQNAMAKAPKGSHVALQTLAEYGVRDAKGAALLREKGPGDAQLTKALDYVDQHPEVFQSKAFQKALEAVGRSTESAPAALVGKGERARLLAQGDLLGIARPEERIPHANREKFAGSKTWKEAVGRLERTKRGQGENLRLVKKQADIARSAVEQTRKTRDRLHARAAVKLEKSIPLTTSEERGLAKSEAAYRLAQRRADKARRAVKVTTADGNTLAELHKEAAAAVRRKATAQTRTKKVWITKDGKRVQIKQTVAKPSYDSRLLDEYRRAVELSREKHGLAPAIWTHHAPANGDKGAGIENRFPTNAGRVEHMREGNLAKGDNLDRSFEGLLRGTVHLPRMRAAGKQFGRDFVKQFKTPFAIDGKQKIVGQGSKDWTAITAPKSKDNPNGGQFDPKSWARFPVREWKNAVKDPFTEDSSLVKLLDEAENGRVKGSEPWVLMPREAIKEARAQISPDHNIITTGANKLSRVASRAILGTNPAWAIAQIPAEGIPLLMAKPSLLNPLKVASLEKDIQSYKKTNPEESIAMQATAGASPLNAAANRTPLDQQETYTPALWDKGAKALTRGKTARSALSFAKLRALGVFDVKRQNEYRTLLAAAEADKRFRSWHSGLTGLFDSSAKLSHQFRGKPRAELWNWLTTDPKGKGELQKITDYVDNIQGNWTAFTRYERALAPLTIFYPFLRYSLRWTLWTFPKTHPITATIAYTLGQANSNQLEKLTGGPLSNPIAYAYPAYQNEKGETSVLPGGSRISPGQSNLTQALQSGNPAQILSSVNPFLGAGITATTGVEPFTGEKSSLPQGEAAINALLSMPAPARLAGLKLGGQSVTSKAFEQYDPNKAARSLVFPFLPQSGANFAESEKLGKNLAKKYGEGHMPYYGESALFQKVMYGHNGGPNPNPVARKKELADAIKEIHASESAGNAVKGAEQKFYPPSKAIPKAVEKEIRAAFENAYKTGPSGEPKKTSTTNPYLEALGGEESKGNPYLEALKGEEKGNPYLKALGG